MGLRLLAMTNIYDSMTSALREHWKAHENAYPERFELTQSTLNELVAKRELVNTSMNFKMSTAAAKEFLGVPIQVSAEGNVMVAADGTRVPLVA